MTGQWSRIVHLALVAQAVSASWAGAAETAATAPASRPNVVLILADDLGWGDIGCHGSATPTPRLDRLFQQGLELGTFLVTPVCSPTRATLLTGRHAARTGVAPFVINPDTGAHLAAEETTLAEAFRSAGYATACFGKWHLGNSPGPNEQGFEVFQGCAGAAVDYFNRTRQRDGKLDWQRNGKPLEEQGYTTDLIRDAAVGYLRDAREPFFLYVPFTAVHNPQQAAQEYLDRVPASITNEAQRIYAAMVIALDDGIGAILKTLDDRRLTERTVVLFTSDNGATPTGSGRPYRGGKHSLYDGGVRAPAVIRWPGRIQGGRRTDALMAAQDVYPTLLSLAGVTPPKGLPLDGLDFTPVFLQEAAGPRQEHFWIWRNCDAIRTERWKLIRSWNTRELYDLHADPQETRNLAASEPRVAADLEAKLDALEAGIPCYPSHVPVRMKSPTSADPKGDVLHIQAIRDDASGREVMSIVLGRAETILSPGDRLEYDLFLAEESTQEGFFIDTCSPNERVAFEGVGAVDQFGTPQQGARFPQARGRWVRRVIGLANRAPRPLGVVRLAFTGKGAGQYDLYVDNVVVRRADGEVIEMYRDGRPNPGRAINTQGYRNVRVDAVPAAEAGPAASRPSPGGF